MADDARLPRDPHRDYGEVALTAAAVEAKLAGEAVVLLSEPLVREVTEHLVTWLLGYERPPSAGLLADALTAALRQQAEGGAIAEHDAQVARDALAPVRFALDVHDRYVDASQHRSPDGFAVRTATTLSEIRKAVS